MDSIRPKILRSIFNIPDSESEAGDDQSDSDHLSLAETETASGSFDSDWDNFSDVLADDDATDKSPVFQELKDIADRLDQLGTSIFNVETLVFQPNTQSPFAGAVPDIHNCEPFLATLLPTTQSNRLFLLKIRSLQNMLIELETMKTHLATAVDSANLVAECHNVQACIETDFHHLISAAWRMGQLKEKLHMGIKSLNMDRYEYAAPALSEYSLAPIATALMILVAMIHCFMGLSRDACAFVLHFLCGLLSLVHQLPGTHWLPHLASNIHKMPMTLETALRYLNLQADLDYYVVCPKCLALYPADGSALEHCTAISLDGQQCNTTLHYHHHRGISSWKWPVHQYTHQRLEVWLSRFLNCPGIEQLLESMKPHPQEIVTDFWGASYLNGFLATCKPGFFDAPMPHLRLAFMVYHDFFNLFSNKMAGKQRSVGVVLMVCLNLPLEIRYKRENIYTVAMILGPSEPSGDEINHFIRPIVNNFRKHFDPSVWISCTHKYADGRPVCLAIVIESMDLIASRQWSGLGSPRHTFLCSRCWIPQESIDQFAILFKERTLYDHLAQVKCWSESRTSAERNALWKQNAARHSEMLGLPSWDPFTTSAIAPMHWSRNVIEKQVRENMGWSWTTRVGIPSAPKIIKPISELGVQWGNLALQLLTGQQLLKSKLPAPLIRYLCNKRDLFNAGLPSRRLLKDLNTWRKYNGIIRDSGELIKQLPAGWESNDRWPESLVQKSRVDDLKALCAQFELSCEDKHIDLAKRLVEYYKPFRSHDVKETEEQEEDVTILGKEVLTDIKADMKKTTLPGWMKLPPKNFGTTTHGKIGAKEYKSLTMVSLTITLICLWSGPNSKFRQHLDHFLHLTIAIHVLAYQSITKDNIATFGRHFTAYLNGLKELYPHCSITPVQHLGLHIPYFLEQFSPATRFNENPCKMFIGMLQDIPTNWRMGELEITLHKEMIMASNFQAVLQQPAITKTVQTVGSIAQDFLNARFPAHTGYLTDDWAPTILKPEGVLLGEDLNQHIRRLFSSSGQPLPPRRQFPCSKIQRGSIIYQPMSASLGNSNIMFEYGPGSMTSRGLYVGRIESIYLSPTVSTPDNSTPLDNKRNKFIIIARAFKPLSKTDLPNDPYYNHHIIGSSGHSLARLFYNELDLDTAYIIEPADIVCHFAACEFEDNQGSFSSPCITILSLDLKHKRYQ